MLQYERLFGTSFALQSSMDIAEDLHGAQVSALAELALRILEMIGGGWLWVAS